MPYNNSNAAAEQPALYWRTVTASPGRRRWYFSWAHYRNLDGFRRFEAHSRSPLHPKVGLPLLSLLNEKRTVGNRVRRLFPNVEVPDRTAKEEQSLDRALGGALRAWRKLPDKRRRTEESALAEAIGKGIERAIASHGGGVPRWRVKARKEEEEAHVDVNEGATSEGRSFGVLLERQDDDAAPAPAFAVEVGRHRNDEWWITVDEGMERVQGLGRFQEPFLLVVLTFREPRHRRKKFVLGSARIGVFLITPRRKCDLPFSTADNYRISMLWRGQTSDVDALSRDFGRALRAALVLPGWNAAAAPMDHACLGPNCCRVGSKVGRKDPIGTQTDGLFFVRCAIFHDIIDHFLPARLCHQVLRAYDNRTMYTARRPDVYLGFLGNETSEVCCYADRDSQAGGGGASPSTNAVDKRDPLPFGECVQASDTPAWVWQFRGTFTVISVPFFEGRHYATRIGEFIPVLRQLKRLHESGYVHGDLRCRNIVFVSGRIIIGDPPCTHRATIKY